MVFKGRAKISHRINLAPLIDVVFLLLIFFLLSSSFAWTEGISILLPRVRHVTRTYVETPTEIYVNKDKIIYVNQEIIPLDHLGSRLNGMVKEGLDRKVLFHAERDLRYEDVCRILDIVKKSGVRGVVLRTEHL